VVEKPKVKVEDSTPSSKRKIGDMMRPPQLSRPNIITEDYNSWSAKSSAEDKEKKAGGE
jgi:hypothetical protein